MNLNALNDYGIPLHACNDYRQDAHYWQLLRHISSLKHDAHWWTAVEHRIANRLNKHAGIAAKRPTNGSTQTTLSVEQWNSLSDDAKAMIAENAVRMKGAKAEAERRQFERMSVWVLKTPYGPLVHRDSGLSYQGHDYSLPRTD